MGLAPTTSRSRRNRSLHHRPACWCPGKEIGDGSAGIEPAGPHGGPPNEVTVAFTTGRDIIFLRIPGARACESNRDLYGQSSKPPTSRMTSPSLDLRECRRWVQSRQRNTVRGAHPLVRSNPQSHHRPVASARACGRMRYRGALAPASSLSLPPPSIGLKPAVGRGPPEEKCRPRRGVVGRRSSRSLHHRADLL